MILVQAAVGNDVKAVPSQNPAVGVLVSGAGVETGISQVQVLEEQTCLQVEEAPVARGGLGGEGRGRR